MFYKHRPLLAYHLIAIAFLESITVDTGNELTTHIASINLFNRCNYIMSVKTAILVEPYRRSNVNRCFFESFREILLLPEKISAVCNYSDSQSVPTKSNNIVIIFFNNITHGVTLTITHDYIIVTLLNVKLQK